MKTTPYEFVFGQPPQLSVFPGAKCGFNIMEEDLEDIINDHLPSKSDDQPPSESDDHPPCKSSRFNTLQNRFLSLEQLLVQFLVFY